MRRHRDQGSALVAQRCAADNADHLAYLLQLSGLELIERERKATERRLKAARFPAAKLLDEFDFATRPSVNKPLVLQLVQRDYLEKRENVLLVGPSGTGKSHLATAFGMAACGQDACYRRRRRIVEGNTMPAKSSTILHLPASSDCTHVRCIFPPEIATIFNRA